MQSAAIRIIFLSLTQQEVLQTILSQMQTDLTDYIAQMPPNHVGYAFNLAASLLHYKYIYFEFILYCFKYYRKP